MQIGIDSFAARFDEAGLEVRPVDRMRELLERIEQADLVGLDVFGIGEHHRREFLDSAPPVILAAAAARTKHIRLTSAVAVLSAAARSCSQAPVGHSAPARTSRNAPVWSRSLAITRDTTV